MRTTFIDCYVKNDSIILWLKKGKRNFKLHDSFTPEIYIKSQNLPEIREKLFINGIHSYYKRKKTFFKGRTIKVLCIPVKKLSAYRDLVKYIEFLTEYKAEIYNADMKLEELYMFQKNLFPTCNVSYREKNGKILSIISDDDSNSVIYDIPDFAIANLEIETQDSLFKTLETNLISVKYNGKHFKGEAKKVLLSLKKEFESQDPDIIWTEHGNLVLPYLKNKFSECGIKFNFNRFEEDDFEFKEGESYWAYTNIIYRTASIFLKGRLHFDTKSFFADDTGFHGIIDGARVCRQRIQRTEMRSAGAAVTNLLLYESFRRNYLLPYKVGMFERFKTLSQLYEADRGSIIFEPQVGFHTHVVELDFVSLYPQIMWKKNLSPETLFCSCCKENLVPDLHYNFCKKKEGVVPKVARDLITRRLELKKQGTPGAKEKASYLKWLLVTMFGYQAFKNRKIGIIEAHESIQAYARDIIMQTVRISESLGWEVVHGIIDSVYVKKKDYSDEDVQILIKKVCDETGFKIAHEGNYRWIVFLPSIVNPYQPISNHFYGVFQNDEIKCRGIEARRKDSPRILSQMQLQMLKVLAQAKNLEEFTNLFPELFQILKFHIKNLKNVSPDDLVISRRLSKTDYVNYIPQRVIIEQMAKLGWAMRPGQRIEYIITDVKNKNPHKRYAYLEDYKGKFDKTKYAHLLTRSLFNILQPFNISQELIEHKLGKPLQTKLQEFAKNV